MPDPVVLQRDLLTRCGCHHGFTTRVGGVSKGSFAELNLSAKWPEDLIIAPIPGYSPQLGWNLTLGGGYFLEIGDKNSKLPIISVRSIFFSLRSLSSAAVISTTGVSSTSGINSSPIT